MDDYTETVLGGILTQHAQGKMTAKETKEALREFGYTADLRNFKHGEQAVLKIGSDTYDFIQYDQGGAVSSPQNYRNVLARLEAKDKEGTSAQDLYDAASFLPGTGEAIAAYELPGILSQSGKMMSSDDFLEAAGGTALGTLGIASVLPIVGPAAKTLRKGLEGFIPYIGPKTAVAGGPDIDASTMKMEGTSSGGGSKASEKPKLKKDPNEDGSYLLNIDNKEYKVSKFYDDDEVHRGEWSIFERAPATEYTEEGWDWMDTVTSRGYAVERIKEIDAAKQVEAPVKKEPSQVEMDFKEAPSNVFRKIDTPVYHFTRNTDPGFTKFDPNKLSFFDLGPHVGSTPRAAQDRFVDEIFGVGTRKKIRDTMQETGQTRDEILATLKLPKVDGNVGYDPVTNRPIARKTLGGSIPLKADLSKPFLNPDTGKPFTEMQLNDYQAEQYSIHRGEYTTASDILGEDPKIDIQDVKKFMRAHSKGLAELGFTHIPYENAVEGVGDLSYVMLVNRPKGSTKVLQSPSAAKDPDKFDDADFMMEDGGVVEYQPTSTDLIDKALFSPEMVYSDAKEEWDKGNYSESIAKYGIGFYADTPVLRQALSAINNAVKRTQRDYGKEPSFDSFINTLKNLMVDDKGMPHMLSKADGGVVSLKDRAVNMTRRPQGIEPFIKFVV